MKNREMHLVSTNPNPIGGADPSVEYPEWYRSVAEKLVDFKDLPENWDSYGAKKINTRVIVECLQIFSALLVNRLLPEPSVFPVADGSVQLEWSICDLDLEIQVYSGNKIHILFEDLIGDIDVVDEVITYDFKNIAKILNEFEVRWENCGLNSQPQRKLKAI